MKNYVRLENWTRLFAHYVVWRLRTSITCSCGCIALDDAKQYVVEIREELFSTYDVSYVNTLSYDTLLLLGYFGSRKNVNYNCVNYFISTVRLCMFKSRQVHMSSGKTLDLKRLVIFTLEKYISYACEYVCTRQHSPRFKRLFSDHNPYVVLTDTGVKYLFDDQCDVVLYF
jgi:hypothetical protein